MAGADHGALMPTTTQTIYSQGTWTNQATEPCLNGILSSSSQFISCPMPAAGVVSNLKVTRLTAVAAASSHTWTIDKNDSATAVTTTIASAGTTNSDVTHTATYAAGDTIRFSVTSTGTPGTSVVIVSFDFTPTTPNQNLIGWGGISNPTSAFQTIWGDLGSGSASGFLKHVISAPGSITGGYWRVRTAPGVGNTRIVRINLNGTLQDGTGGSVDTTITVSGTNTVANASFTLPLVAGDVLYLEEATTGTPATSNSVAGAYVHLPTLTAASMVCTSCSSLSTTVASYQFPVAGRAGGTTQSATENTRQLIGGITSQTYSTIRVAVSAAPGVGKSWTVTLRKDTGGGSADTALTVVVSGASTGAGATIGSPVTIAAGDLWDISVTPSGTPTASTDMSIALGFLGTSGAGPLVDAAPLLNGLTEGRLV
jgi:hypothetical protein